MKKLILATFISLFILQPLAAIAAPVTPSQAVNSKIPVFATIQKMEEQCMGAYTNQFYGAAVRPKLTFIKSSSKRIKDEIELIVEFSRSDIRGVDKHRCTFKNGMLISQGKLI